MTKLEHLTRENLPLHLPTWAKAIHEQNVAKGWWEGGVRSRDLVETMLLIKSELIEAFEEYRKPQSTPSRVYTVGDSAKPEGIPIEIADDVIRTMDLIGALSKEYGIEIEKSFWDIPEKPISTRMSHAIDDEITDLCRTRAGYDVALATLGEEVACRFLLRELIAHLVRVFRLADVMRFDLGLAIEAKHAYNATRGYRHGNKKA